MSVGWAEELQKWRRAMGLSRHALAAAAGVSEASIKAYERGLRRPSREALTALLDALAVEPAGRRAILVGAGFAPDGRHPERHLPQPEHSFEEALAEIEASPWPAHLSNAFMDVIGANSLAQALWGVDLSAEYNEPVERSLLASMSTPRIADRLANWDEAVRLLLSLVKGSFGDLSEAGPTNPYLSAVVARFMQGEPRYVQAAIRAWSEVEPRILKWRFSYPVDWKQPGLGLLRFRVVVNPVNREEHITINDWIPVDAATWEAIEKLRAGGSALPLTGTPAAPRA